MDKKLMVLASGVLAVLALAALPAVASAGEYTADCENGAATCTGTVAGGFSALRNDKGEEISCASIGGKATVNNGSSTGALELTYKGCKEQVTGFGFSCNNTEVAGEVRTGSVVTHLIYLEANKTTPGLKVTLPAAGVTFNCPGYTKKLVTGKVIGHISNPGCSTFQASHTADFKESSAGVQRWMQATTAGETTDLISNNDSGEYTTSAQIGSIVITWTGTKVKLTC